MLYGFQFKSMYMQLTSFFMLVESRMNLIFFQDSIFAIAYLKNRPLHTLYWFDFLSPRGRALFDARVVSMRI